MPFIHLFISNLGSSGQRQEPSHDKETLHAILDTANEAVRV